MKLILRTAMALGAGLFVTGLFAATASADISGNTNYAVQLGANGSFSTQSAAAISGAATAADDGDALTGAATATTAFQGSQALGLSQYNQADLTGGALNISGNTNGSEDVPVLQSAANLIENAQENAAASGAADATGSATSTTGAATSTVANIQAQVQELLQASQSAFPP